MGTTLRTLIAMLAWIPPAMAAGAEESEGSGFLVTLFLGFGAMIIIFQLLPSLILFGSMLRGLVSRKSPVAEEAVKRF
jgi:hypothetical protein